MSSGAPAWLVLVTAALAVVGTLAAAIITQVLSGRREARQWERQNAQNEVRCERERAERREQWEREDHARWHQERLSGYSDLLQRIEEWDMAMSEVLPAEGPSPSPLPPEGQRRLNDALVEVARAKNKVRLFASEDTTREAAHFYVDAVVCLARLSDGTDDQEILRQTRFELRALHDTKRELLALIRRDLGIGPPAT